MNTNSTLIKWVESKYHLHQIKQAKSNVNVFSLTKMFGAGEKGTWLKRTQSICLSVLFCYLCPYKI